MGAAGAQAWDEEALGTSLCTTNCCNCCCVLGAGSRHSHGDGGSWFCATECADAAGGELGGHRPHAGI